MIASLGSGSFSSIVQVSFDSEGFKESSAIFIMVGKLLLPLAMLLECFFGPSLEVPRVLGTWIISIGVDYGVEKPLLQSFLEEFYGSYIIKGEPSISGKLFEITYVGIKVFFVLQASDFSLHIPGFMGVGEGLSEIRFKEVPELFIVISIAGVDSGVKEV